MPVRTSYTYTNGDQLNQQHDMHWRRTLNIVECQLQTLKTNGRQFDNLVVAGGTVSCHNDNLRCHQWRGGCQIDDILVSVKSVGFLSPLTISYACVMVDVWVTSLLVARTQRSFTLNRSNYTSPISHNAPFCNRNVHISVTKWCIVGYLSDALWFWTDLKWFYGQNLAAGPRVWDWDVALYRFYKEKEDFKFGDQKANSEVMKQGKEICHYTQASSGSSHKNNVYHCNITVVSLIGATIPLWCDGFVMTWRFPHLFFFFFFSTKLYFTSFIHSYTFWQYIINIVLGRITLCINNCTSGQSFSHIWT